MQREKWPNYEHVLSEIPGILPFLFASMLSPVTEVCSGAVPAFDFSKHFLDIVSFYSLQDLTIFFQYFKKCATEWFGDLVKAAVSWFIATLGLELGVFFGLPFPHIWNGCNSIDLLGLLGRIAGVHVREGGMLGSQSVVRGPAAAMHWVPLRPLESQTLGMRCSDLYLTSPQAILMPPKVWEPLGQFLLHWLLPRRLFYRPSGHWLYYNLQTRCSRVLTLVLLF